MGNNPLGRHVLVCRGAGEHSGPARSFRDRTLQSYGLVYVSEGKGGYVQPSPFGVDRNVVAPALISITAGVAHGYGPDSDGWSEHWILFSGIGIQLYRDLGILDPSSPVTALKAPVEGIGELFAELKTALSSVGLRRSLEASLTTQRILLALVSTPVTDVRDSRESHLLREFKDSSTLDLSIADHARRMRVSLPELRAVVRSTTGMSPLNFLVENRLARAQILLSGTRLSIGEIAGQVGYEDAAYFSRIFTKRVGVSPSVFRHQQNRVEVSRPGSINEQGRRSLPAP